MNEYTHTHKYIHSLTHTHTHTHIYIYIYTHNYIHSHKHIDVMKLGLLWSKKVPNYCFKRYKMVIQKKVGEKQKRTLNIGLWCTAVVLYRFPSACTWYHEDISERVRSAVSSCYQI